MQTSKQQVDVVLRVRGLVQGVGFRPFVHRAASRLKLRGWVRNDPQGVLIRAVGEASAVNALVRTLNRRAPASSRVQSIQPEVFDQSLAPAGDDFVIVTSEPTTSLVETAIPLDLSLCPNCRRELADPENRRNSYPFINCTQCGPRYSLIEALPYDRPHTTMRAFRMCPECRGEYHEPGDRRFHAQPNACPTCGPQVTLTDASGRELAPAREAIAEAARLINEGRIIAVKGLGGFHLFCDGTNDAAVAELRRRKQREEKPLAIMFRDLPQVRAHARVTPVTSRLLSSRAAPIVLVPRRADSSLSSLIAPGNPWLGALLAYTPLHVLLMGRLRAPAVATSGNVADDPLCCDDHDAHARLEGIADAFLGHNRGIAHSIDDSVVRVSHAGPILMRRSRGYAPAPLTLPGQLEGSWLCTGAESRNTIGVAQGSHVVLSPHIGDLRGETTRELFAHTATMLGSLHGTAFTHAACDKHPDYASTVFAARLGVPIVAVQHHLAHVLACLLEHQHPADGVLGVSWDGSGAGEDGTLWGGEFLILRRGTATRFGRLRPFKLAGASEALRDPRRVALGLLHEAGNPRFAAIAHGFGVCASESGVLHSQLTRRIDAPMTSSVGRLFDAVGALLGLNSLNRFDGQAPLAVEAAAMAERSAHAMLPLPLRTLNPGDGAACELNWQPLVETLLARRDLGDAPSLLAAAYHRALAHGIVEVAQRAGMETVALTGGCFQNALLLDLTVTALRAAGFHVLIHRELPPNDGNIAAGQALGALLGLTSVITP